MVERKETDAHNGLDDKARHRGVLAQMRWGWTMLNEKRKPWFKTLLPCAVLISLCVAIWIGGPIGQVKVSPTHYVPYHEVDLLHFAGYVLGALLLLLLLVWWRSDAFLLIGGKDAEPISRKDRFYGALRCLQMSLLHLLVFGLPIGVAAWLTFGVSLWFALLLLLVCLLLIPALSITSCRYMWTEATYRQALRYAFSATCHYWGRTFLFLLGALCVALVLTAIVVLPAAILVLVVYDAQTATAMGDAAGLPLSVAWAEYVFLFLGTLATLFIFLWVRTSLKGHYLTLEALTAQRHEAEAETLRYEEEQKKLKLFTEAKRQGLKSK